MPKTCEAVRSQTPKNGSINAVIDMPKTSIVPKKILVYGPNWLGDTIMSFLMIDALRHFYPRAKIDIITRKDFVCLFELVPGVGQVFPFSKLEHATHWDRFKYGKRFANKGYDLFVSVPTSLTSGLMAYGTGCKHRLGFNAEGRGLLMTHCFSSKPTDHMHYAEKCAYLICQYAGANQLPKGLRIRMEKRFGQPFPFPKGGKHIVLGLSSEAASRQVPFLKAVSLVKHLMDGMEKDTNFYLVGALKSRPHVRPIFQEINQPQRVFDYTGKTSVKELAHMIAEADGMVSVDSGQAHMADALNKPLVVMMGPGETHRFCPYNKDSAALLREDLPCSPCTLGYCKYHTNDCLTKLPNERISQALTKVMNGEKVSWDR